MANEITVSIGRFNTNMGLPIMVQRAGCNSQLAVAIVLRQARAERIAKAVKAALDKDFAEFPEDDRQAAPPLDGRGG